MKNTGRKEEKVVLGSGDLSLEQVIGVARRGWAVAEIGDDDGNAQAQASCQRMKDSRAWVESAIQENEIRKARGEKQLLAFYGINTGFGSKAGEVGLSSEDIPWVSRNLIMSHSTGVGSWLHPEIVRAAMLIRANSLALGYSGVRAELVNTLVRMLNRGVCPLIPEYGSVGASGDLIPLSHLAQVLSKAPSQAASGAAPADYDESGKACISLNEGACDATSPDASSQASFVRADGSPVPLIEFDGSVYAVLSGAEAMQARGIDRLELQAKEGLALNNGTTFSAAIAALALYDAENILRHAEIAAALSLEALIGFRDAFLPQIQTIRRHRGQIECAARILKIVEGSTLLDGSLERDPRSTPPQDPYVLRVAPQVLGAVWDTLGYIRSMLEEEINAATDNPMIFPDLPRGYKAISGGNFHGAPLAYGMDFLSIVMTDLGSLSERRMFYLLHDKLNRGLPSMLVEDEADKPGRTSGLMMVQYLAASLVSDCKTLAHPDSVDSIPTCADQEGHVSMSFNAARHARTIVESVRTVVAAELLCAYTALDWRLQDLARRLAEPMYQPGTDAGAALIIEKLIHQLRQDGTLPRSGEGSAAAMELIAQWLYGEGNGLPLLGREPTAKDNFTQPYILRMTGLLRSGDLVKVVYNIAE